MRKMVTEIRTGSGTRTRPGGLGHDPFAIVNPISVEAATADFYEKVDADLLAEMRRNDPKAYAKALEERIAERLDMRDVNRGRRRA